MARDQYGSWAADYHWFLDDVALRLGTDTPTVRAVIAGLAPGTRVVDVACGIGVDALALHERGLHVIAADASSQMVELARARLRSNGAGAVPVLHVAWADLPRRLDPSSVDVVVCLGNSIAHARDEQEMLAAFDAFRTVLAPGGMLVLDTLDWDLVAAGGSRTTIEPQIVVRDGRRCLRVHTWHLARDAGEPHVLELALVFLDGDRATLRAHPVSMYPFRREELRARLATAGFVRIESDAIPGDDRYTVLARRPY